MQCNLTVNAEYTINVYKVRFIDWDDSLIVKLDVPHGSNATPPADSERTGYTFTGWDKSFTNVQSNLTVTAEYTINSYMVTFKDWDGSVIKNGYGRLRRRRDPARRPGKDRPHVHRLGRGL